MNFTIKNRMNIGDEVKAWMWVRGTGVVLEIKDDVYVVGEKAYLTEVNVDRFTAVPGCQWMRENHIWPTGVPFIGPEVPVVTCPSCGREGDHGGGCECEAAMMRGDEDAVSFSGHEVGIGDAIDIWWRMSNRGVIISDEKEGFFLVRVEGASPRDIWYTVGSLEPLSPDAAQDGIQSVG